MITVLDGKNLLHPLIDGLPGLPLLPVLPLVNESHPDKDRSYGSECKMQQVFSAINDGVLGTHFFLEKHHRQ